MIKNALVIIAKVKTIVIYGKHNFAVGYINIIRQNIAIIVTRWIYEKKDSGMNTCPMMNN